MAQHRMQGLLLCFNIIKSHYLSATLYPRNLEL
jgi:hypothetical protein